LRRLERKSHPPQASDSRVDDGSMSKYEFTISLRLRHPAIDPVRITHTLAIEPQHSWKVGDPRRDAAGAALEGVHHESFWVAQLMEQPQLATAGVSVESVLLQTLAHLRRSQSFLAQLDADGGVAELHISLFARTDFRLELSAQSLALLGHLGLAVALDVHPQPAHGVSEPQAI
jgi:Domain of unknown function (DUF4279)